MSRVAMGLAMCLCACEPEVVVDENEDPNAALHERYGEDWVPSTVDEWCEATQYKAPPECDPEDECLRQWVDDEDIPEECRKLVMSLWECALDAEWTGCVVGSCQAEAGVFRECCDAHYAMTGSSSSSAGQGAAQGGAGGSF